MSRLTLTQRRSLLRRVCKMPDQDGNRRMGEYHCDLPPAALVHVQDQWGTRTSQADTSMKALRAAYAWAMERGWVAHSPAVGLRNRHRGRGGATPWSSDDLRAFLRTHPEGDPARMWLMLAIWTGARLGDLAILGRRHERVIDGIAWIEWAPGKKGSAPVSMPVSDQLAATIRGMKVVGDTYILSAHGRPYASGAALGVRVQRWTSEAGLSKRSSHGLRKALGGLLAEAGATQHQIMSVLAHTNPKTSEIYTRSAQRRALAAQAINAISGMRIG